MLTAALIVCLVASSSLAQGVSAPCPCGPLPTYKVNLDNCGPRPVRLPAKTAPGITTAPVQKPTVVLPYKVPTPRTTSNVCRCVKTIVKPQVIQQEIVVPVVKKFVQTLAKPAVQVIEYAAIPVNCPQIEEYADCAGPTVGCRPVVGPICASACGSGVCSTVV